MSSLEEASAEEPQGFVFSDNMEGLGEGIASTSGELAGHGLGDAAIEFSALEGNALPFGSIQRSSVGKPKVGAGSRS